MPVMTGVEFLKEIEKIDRPSSPMKVIISGFTQEGEVDMALKTKLIHQFVSKPWSYQDLKGMLLAREGV